MSYDLTALENNTSLLNVFTTMNTASNEFLIVGILVSLFVILFILFKSYETLTALRTSAFITSIISILFYLSGFLSLDKAIYPLVILGITIFISIISIDTN